jgi:predicted ATPase
MLKRVKIQGYKSLVDVEVKLQPLSVLFGPNAAGKSNFLDALQLLARIATSARLRDAFAFSYRGTPSESFFFGSDGVQGLLTKEKALFSIEVDVELSQSVIDTVNLIIKDIDASEELPSPIRERYLRYHISIALLPQTGVLYIADEYLAPLNDQGDLMQERKFLHWDGSYRRGEGLKPVHMKEQQAVSFLSPYSSYPQFYVSTLKLYLVAIREELNNWLFFYLEPRERMRIPGPIKEVRHIGLMGEELAAFLNTLRALDEPQFKAVEKALHLLVPSFTGIDISFSRTGEVELSLMQGKTPISASILSEGTLRMLGLLALGGAKEPPTLLGFEEPENGIHPDRLDLVATLLKTLADDGTQVIVTTHSPTLLDLLPEESLYVFQFEKDKTIVNTFSEQKDRRRKRRKSKTSNVEETPVSELLLRGDLYA